MKNAALLFLKEPVEGKVKTRLAKDIGNASATEHYLHFLKHISSKLQKIHCDVLVIYSCATKSPTTLYSIFPNADFAEQSSGDLGKRLTHGFQYAFDQDYTNVIALGGDSPDLPEEYIINSFAQLDRHQSCIGPTEDGGYYLIGMSKFMPELFQNITWSTSTVFAETREIIHSLKISCHVLPEWYDIDTIDDLKRYQNSPSP